MIEIPKIFCYGSPRFGLTIASLKHEQADFASAFQYTSGRLSTYPYGMILKEENGIQRLLVTVNPMKPDEVWREVPFFDFIKAVHRVYDSLQREQYIPKINCGSSQVESRIQKLWDDISANKISAEAEASDIEAITDIRPILTPINPLIIKL